MWTAWWREYVGGEITWLCLCVCLCMCFVPPPVTMTAESSSANQRQWDRRNFKYLNTGSKITQPSVSSSFVPSHPFFTLDPHSSSSFYTFYSSFTVSCAWWSRLSCYSSSHCFLHTLLLTGFAWMLFHRCAWKEKIALTVNRTLAQG